MLDIIINTLMLDDFYGVSKNIDIAKGLYKTPQGIREGLKQRKRKKAWRLKR